MNRAMILVAAALVLSAPAAVEAQELDDLELPDQFEGAEAGVTLDVPWWEVFGDQHLRGVIEDALRSNYDLAAARARLRAAEAQVTRAASPLWPSLTLDASFGGQPTSSLGFQFGGLGSITGGASSSGSMPSSAQQQQDLPEVAISTSAMVNLRYQIDLWGRTALAWRASQLRRDATGDDGDALAAATCYQIGEAYYDAVAAQEQIDIVRQQIELNAQLVEILELRYENDQARATEVLQQRQQLAQARARLPQARAARRRALQRLALLMGQTAGGVSSLQTASELPELPSPPDPGTPQELIERRADLRAAQARLEAAERQERSARRALFPTLAISGNAGYQGFRLNEYRDQGTWGFGVSLSVPAFNGFADHAAIREARAQIDQARSGLDQGVVQAISDVENALANEAEQREQVEAFRDLLEAARQAFVVARDSFVAGVGNYLSILTALSALQQAELTMLQAERSLISARLALYQTLGGPWTEGLSRLSMSEAP